ncbi:hypothetical protein ACLKA6_010135 [Drosophila palustris]
MQRNLALTLELEQQYRDASGSEHSDSKSRSRSVSPVPRDRVVPQGIHFDGQSDPLSFIERVEERATAHLIDLAHLSQAIPELLTGNASDWFRVSRLQGASWATFKQDFLDFFLPPRYFQRLEDQIRARQQRPGEAFKTYIVELRLLMKRASYSGVQELDRAYENLLPEYQLYIRRYEAHSLAQLTQLATDFEFVRDRERQSSGPAQLGLAIAHNRDEPAVAPRHRNPFRDDQPSHRPSGGEPPISRMMQESGPAIDVQRACRRCGEIGHQARVCRNRQLYYCWRCGERGIKTTECCGLASGNGQRPYLPQDQSRSRQATIDTGATRSFISEAAANQLGTRQLRDVRAKVSMADGSRATVCKALMATVQLGEKCACIPFLVLSTVVDDVILGIDFLCAIRASLHCGPTQLQLTPMCLQTPAGRRNTIRATTASQDPLPGWETTVGGNIEAYITHTQTASDAIPKTTARTPRKKAKEGQERCQQCSRGSLVDGEPSLRPLPFGGTTAGPGDLSAPASAKHRKDNIFGGTKAGPGDQSASTSAKHHEDNPFGGTKAGPGDLSAAQKHHGITAGPGDLSAPRKQHGDIPFGGTTAGKRCPGLASQKLVYQDPKAGTPRNVYKDPSGGNPMQGNQDPKAGTPHLKAVTSRSKDGAPTTPGQEDEEGHEAQTTEEVRSTRSSSWGPLEDGEPSQRPYPFGETTTEVCAIAIPPEPDPHVNEADDDDPSEAKPGQEEEPELEPWVRDFLERELAQFETLTGVTHIAEHVITMKDDRPIKQRFYPKNPAMQRIIDDAPIVLVGKKTGDVRMCIDYRQLNANSIPDAYPLPRIHHILERLRNARYISTLDLKSGYWQIPMARGSREYTAFTVPGRGLFQWKVMPFGLHSAPATFQRALDSVIGPDMEPFAFAYLDDIIVSGATLEEHVHHLGEVLRRLRQANLRLNRATCKFFRRSLVNLGHVISGEGIHTDPDKIAAVRQLQPPTTCRELRRCLWIASWYRRFKWDWKPEQQAAFEELKARLTEAPVLACPDFSEKFVLQTDASDCGLGAVLTQQHQGAERVIAYVSRRLVKAEENYSATEKECLAIVWAIRKLRCYLEGYRFDVVTDHLALKWLNSIDNPTGRIARWALELQQYQFDIHYRRGKQNVVADALSLEVTLQMAKEEEPSCKWITRLTKRIREAPDRFPDFTIEGSQVYRHLGHRPEEEDYVPWKLTWPTDPTSLPRPRGSSWESVRDTAGGTLVGPTTAGLIGEIFAAEVNRQGAEDVDLPLLGDDEYLEVLAAAGDVEVAQDLPWEQLDWVEIPAGWRTFGLGEMIPAVVLDAVGVALPKAMAKGPTKFVVEANGRRFQIRISRAGIVTAFLRPPNNTAPRSATSGNTRGVCVCQQQQQQQHSAAQRVQWLHTWCVCVPTTTATQRRAARPAATHVVCVCASNINNSNTAPRSATSGNTPGVRVCQQQQQHSAAQRNQRQHTWCVCVPATTATATQRRAARPVATHVVCVCASNNSNSNTAPRSATSGNTPGVRVCQQQQQHSAAQRNQRHHTWCVCVPAITATQRRAARPAATHVVCVCANNNSNTAPRSATSGNTRGVCVCQQQQQQQHSAAQRVQWQHTWCVCVPTTTATATQRRAARPAATHVVCVCASNINNINTAPRSATSGNTPGVRVCRRHQQRTPRTAGHRVRALGEGHRIGPTGWTWYPGGGLGMESWSVPLSFLEPSPGIRPGNTWPGFVDRILVRSVFCPRIWSGGRSLATLSHPGNEILFGS